MSKKMKKTSDKEIRAIGEMRAEGDADNRKIVGHAAVFDTPADIGGLFLEQIRKGAFEDAIKEDDVRALIDHDSSLILGRNKSGTLKLSEDATGLRVEIEVPDTQVGRDLITSMERGDISQMSFGFSMRGGVEEWDDSGDVPLRTIEKVGRLLDVSVVTFPAYEDAQAAVRSLEAYRKDITPKVDKERLRRRLELADREIAL